MHHCAPALLAVPLLALALAGLAQGKGSKLPRITIAPGVDMPMVNCGHPDAGCQHGLGPGCAAAAQNMSMMWLRLGGRGLDTAFGYDNQAQVGAAVKAAIAQNLANRSDVFITTKINPDKQGGCTQEAALAAIRQDVQQLGVHYVDLVLQHFPCATDAQNQAVWSGLALAKKLGLARSVGVSHYGVADLRAIMALNKVRVAFSAALHAEASGAALTAALPAWQRGRSARQRGLKGARAAPCRALPRLAALAARD